MNKLLTNVTFITLASFATAGLAQSPLSSIDVCAKYLAAKKIVEDGENNTHYRSNLYPSEYAAQVEIVRLANLNDGDAAIQLCKEVGVTLTAGDIATAKTRAAVHEREEKEPSDKN